MKSVSSKNKLWIIITVVVLAVGMALIGFLGFNNTVDGKASFELNVSVDANINDASANMMQETEKYLDEAGVSDKEYTRQILNEDCIVIYKFDKDVSENIDVEELKTAVSDAVGSGLIIEVTLSQVVPLNNGQKLLTILGLGIILVAIFVYLLFMTKLSGALSTLFVMVVSAVIYIAMLGITRLPANGTALLFSLTSAIFGGMLSVGILGRLKEELKNEGNNKLSYQQIADKATYKSGFRFLMFLAGAFIISILLVALGVGYLRLYGAGLFMSAVVASFVAYMFTAFIWTALMKSKKDKKSKTVITPEESVE